MKKLSAILLLFFGLVGFSAAQTVTIGNQVWTTKNLNVDKFRNGEAIPQAKTIEVWEAAAENKQPAWCYHEFNPDYSDVFIEVKFRYKRGYFKLILNLINKKREKQHMEILFNQFRYRS